MTTNVEQLSVLR